MFTGFRASRNEARHSQVHLTTWCTTTHVCGLASYFPFVASN